MDGIKYDCRLILNTSGKFYLCIPCHVNACDKQTSDIDKSSWGALDPGVRAFQTIYSPSNNIAYKIGQGDISRVYRLCIALDHMISEDDRTIEHRIRGQKSHRTLKKKIKRMRLKIKHIIDEVHWKTIQFLLDHFSNILIPIFNVQNMINRKTRKISRKSVRQMLGWRHYNFRQRLIASAQRRNSSRIYVVGEEYTTQTCGSCLRLNKKVGGRKIYKCPSCGITIDRDLNGSRNIFMMNCHCSRSTNNPISKAIITLKSSTVSTHLMDLDLMT